MTLRKNDRIKLSKKERKRLKNGGTLQGGHWNKYASDSGGGVVGEKQRRRQKARARGDSSKGLDTEKIESSNYSLKSLRFELDSCGEDYIISSRSPDTIIKSIGYDRYGREVRYGGGETDLIFGNPDSAISFFEAPRKEGLEGEVKEIRALIKNYELKKSAGSSQNL